MKSFVFATFSFLLIFSAKAVVKKDPVSGWYVSHFENVLGTSMELKLALADPSKAELAEAMVLSEIDRLNAVFSSYDQNSEWRRWQSSFGLPVKVSAELMEVMQYFDAWKLKTKGALNPAVGALTTVWKNAEVAQTLPGTQELSKAVLELQTPQWTLDPAHLTATHIGKSPLLFNSFVKSYIIRKAADKVVTALGVESLVLNIGGDIVVAGKRSEQIGIANPKNFADNSAPFCTLNIHNKAVATSGNYKRGYSIDGKWYSHIIDPRNGQTANEVISATVVASDAVMAGALATAFTILTPQDSRKLAEENGSPAFCLVKADGEIIRSENWKELEINTPVTEGFSDKKSMVFQKSWKKGFELQVQLELARFEGRSRRPFVAVWLENDNGETVKTLALWYNKPRWLPDLKEWYHKNAQRYAPDAPLPMNSISSATRAAGSYILKWDGKDEKGEFVKSGNYTVYIEVAREHGTYQLIKKEVTCKNKEQEITLDSNTEVSSVSLSYKKSNTQE